MAFDMFKLHKLSDHLEGEAYEHAQWAIQSFYELELTKNEYGYEQGVEEVLNEEQINEIEAYVDEWCVPEKYHEPYTISALTGIVDRWHEEHDVEQDEPTSWVDNLTPKSPECMSDAPAESKDDIMPDGNPRTFQVPS